jgi:hypothetical protein
VPQARSVQQHVSMRLRTIAAAQRDQSRAPQYLPEVRFA